MRPEDFKIGNIYQITVKGFYEDDKIFIFKLEKIKNDYKLLSRFYIYINKENFNPGSINFSIKHTYYKYKIDKNYRSTTNYEEIQNLYHKLDYIYIANSTDSRHQNAIDVTDLYWNLFLGIDKSSNNKMIEYLQKTINNI